MVQEITRELNQRIQARRTFFIQFPIVDPDGTYYPRYYFNNTEIQPDDIVAWFWGDSIKLGQVYAIADIKGPKATVLAYILPRNKDRPQKKWKEMRATVSASTIRCIFAPV
jgi:hypothetical protein